MPLHEMENTVWAGTPVANAEKALIMVHGRGADAHDILSLSSFLNVKDFAIAAPQATNHQWYPYSFLEKPELNEPWLSSALDLLQKIVEDFRLKGISSENIYLLGFSQGACLVLEFAARNAMRYGGIVAFTGGLIGDTVYKENYKGDFLNTPILLSTGDHDPHVPLKRVQDTRDIFNAMNADVQTEVYKNKPHTILKEEILHANKFVFDN